MTVTPDFWAGRRVLVTGHTGFKGGWLSMLLTELGADVTGISLPPENPDGVYLAAGVSDRTTSYLVDILDRDQLRAVVHQVEPDIVFHLAAQALVLPSIEQPAATFATNVVGTANLLEACIEVTPLVTLVVTSDKVYANVGDGRPFAEGDRLGGGDPYSASKAAAELVVASWRHTYAGNGTPAIATARAGNVVGGGDAAIGRLLPDLLRAFAQDEPVTLRNPEARRPWQFVLEPLAGYLAYVEALAVDHGGRTPLALNFGPLTGDDWTVAEVADRAIELWGKGRWERAVGGRAVEAPVLTLNADLARRTIGWEPVLDIDGAIRWTIDWLRADQRGADLAALCRGQIRAYREQAGW